MRERVVVMGGAGFLGSHLCTRLVNEGCDVVCVDNYLTGEPKNLDHLHGDPRFQIVEADVSDGIPVDGPVTAVLHFASPASPVDYARYPVETLRAGSLATFHALDLARRNGARMVLASTSEVYGDPLVHPQDETYWGNVNPIGPRACYDEAKRFSEAAAVTYRNTHGVDVGIVRIFNTFGPRMRAGDGRAVPTFIVQSMHGEPLTVFGDGSQTRSICYVDDLVDGVVRMMRSSVPGPVNLGAEGEVTMLELAKWIRDLTGSASEIRHEPLPQDDPRIRRPDVSTARRLLGWEASTPPEEGLKTTIAWFREQYEEEGGGRSGG
jgi:dTDP-glucose 4,6-dehydratase